LEHESVPSPETDREFGSLIRSALCDDPVAGSTHGYYRYPARFSPQFARAAVESLTDPGDTVLDPFMGGGTAAVEALACGRRFVGCDLNSLSGFLARVKTSPLGGRDLAEVQKWVDGLAGSLPLGAAKPRHTDWTGYQINTPWWIRGAIEGCLDSAEQLETGDQRSFARCALLRTGQWALDCRKKVPSAREFLNMLCRNVELMDAGMREYAARLSQSGDFKPRSNRRLLIKDSADLATDKRIPRSWLPPKLILTSPPYPGVHILYHRWQVQGRRETPAPYWIAGSLDGYGASHYTFGDRQRKSTDNYFERLASCIRSIVALMGPDSLFVQLVAFSNPDTQMRPYMATLRSVGLTEAKLPGRPGQIRRDVPNRKWYAQLLGRTAPSKEIVLVHRKA
jgi:DNA modification methylase